MSKTRIMVLVFIVLLLGIIVLPSLAYSAESSTDMNALDQVYDQITTNAQSWTYRLKNTAMRIFWALVLISMVWTFGSHLMGGSFNFGAFFHEFIRFTCFVGFWKLMLDEGTDFLNAIITSFYQLGGNMEGAATAFQPSSLMWKALHLYENILRSTVSMSFFDRFIMIILGLGIMIIIGVMCANILVLMCAGTILCYGGVVYFGFGGSRWTSEIAVNYLKSVLSIAINIFSTLLLVELSTKIVTDMTIQMEVENAIFSIQKIAAIFIAAVIMAMVTMKVPPMLAGIVSAPTGSIDGIGVGQAMRTMSAMAGAMYDTAKSGLRGGSNAAAAIGSAHAKMDNDVKNRIEDGLQSGSGGMLARGFETMKNLGSATFQNFREGGHKGGVSGLLDGLVKSDNKERAEKKDRGDTQGKLDSLLEGLKGGGAGASSGAASGSSSYASSVPDGSGGSDDQAKFDGGSIGGGSDGGKDGADGGKEMTQGSPGVDGSPIEAHGSQGGLAGDAGAYDGPRDAIPDMLQGSPGIDGGGLPGGGVAGMNGGVLPVGGSAGVAGGLMAMDSGSSVNGGSGGFGSSGGGSDVGGKTNSIPDMVQSAPGLDGSPVAAHGSRDAGAYDGVRDAIPDKVQGAPSVASGGGLSGGFDQRSQGMQDLGGMSQKSLGVQEMIDSAMGKVNDAKNKLS